MFFDFRDLVEPDPFFGFFLQQFQNQIFQFLADIDDLREMRLHINYFFKHFVVVFIIERRQPEHHFKQDDPEAPDIHVFIVSFLIDDLGRHVFGRAHKTFGLLFLGKDLRDPEIRQAGVAFVIQ